ncbi:40S ribosomal protein S30 [Coemansia sp. S3946]|nr:40S ribosomal protein S30 [Coemansia sp. S3946]
MHANSCLARTLHAPHTCVQRYARQKYARTGAPWLHGSLARAGKVKNQTPKVEATEKPKKVTGRAMKRAKYIRRFVNVTLQPGGKRRMNPPPTAA